MLGVAVGDGDDHARGRRGVGDAAGPQEPRVAGARLAVRLPDPAQAGRREPQARVLQGKLEVLQGLQFEHSRIQKQRLESGVALSYCNFLK